jgi:hypothetical protein
VDGSPCTIYEVGESLKGDALVGTGDGENGEVGDDGYSVVVLSAAQLTPSLRLSF